jgi:hypothetical protein
MSLHRANRREVPEADIAVIGPQVREDQRQLFFFRAGMRLLGEAQH